MWSPWNFNFYLFCFFPKQRHVEKLIDLCSFAFSLTLLGLSPPIPMIIISWKAKVEYLNQSCFELMTSNFILQNQTLFTIDSSASLFSKQYSVHCAGHLLKKCLDWKCIHTHIQIYILSLRLDRTSVAVEFLLIKRHKSFLKKKNLVWSTSFLRSSKRNTN